MPVICVDVMGSDQSPEVVLEGVRMAHYNLSFMYRYSHNTIEVGYKLLRITVIYENVNNASYQEALY